MEKLLPKIELNFDKNLFKEEKNEKRKNSLVWTLICLFFISLILLKTICPSQSKKIKNNMIFAETSVIGEINCNYEIQSIDQNTKLLGNEFSKTSLFDLYIDVKKVKYNKEFKFTSFGRHKIQIKLYKKINMDYMFKKFKI